MRFFREILFVVCLTIAAWDFQLELYPLGAIVGGLAIIHLVRSIKE